MFHRLFLACTLFAIAVCASAQSYGLRKININAGVVIIESAQSASAGQPINYTPFVWLNLDRASNIKPASWNIQNPQPMTQVTKDIQDRWGGLGVDLGFAAPNLLSRITKTEAPYWEVRLSKVSDAQLGEFDILVLPAYGYTALNSVERDKLRKFVDQGGVLWVDIASTTNLNDAHSNTLPIPFDKRTFGSPPAVSYPDPFSPVVSNPFYIAGSTNPLRIDPLTHIEPVDLVAAGLSGYEPIQSWVAADYAKWRIVSDSGRGPVISVGKLGNGYIVLTSGGTAAALNRIQTSAGNYDTNNRYAASGGTLDFTGQTAAKLAVNLINLGSGYTLPGGGPRKANANPIDIEPPLIRRFALPSTVAEKNQTPILYKGVVYVSLGRQLFAFDANPKSDLDGDGDPDDGLRDYSQGEPWDLLWSSRDLGSILSAPAAADLPASGVPDQVFVVDTNGTTYAFDSLQLSGGTIQPLTNANPLYTVNPPTAVSIDTSAAGAGPYAPTVHDGLLYITGTANTGTGGALVWIIDPIGQKLMDTSGTAWRVGGASGLTLPDPSGAPTVGYIPIVDGSGGYDRVLYYPGRPQSFSGPTGTASLNSLWLGVRGESPPPGSITYNPTSLNVLTRAGRQGLNVYIPSLSGGTGPTAESLGVKLTVLQPNGDPLTDTQMKSYFTGVVTQTAGNLTFGLSQPLPPTFGVRLDYTIDWGFSNGAAMAPAIRGQLFFPDDATLTNPSDKRRIIGDIAMSTKGTLYCIVSTGNSGSAQSSGGDFYTIREDVGKGGFRMLTRYSLYPPHSVVLNQATPYNSPATVGDVDPLTTFEPTGILKGPFASLTWVGTPSVRNDTVYVVASGRKNNGGFQAFVPFSVLFAFKAEPQSPEIRVGDLGGSFTLSQPDLTRSQSKTNPVTFNDVKNGQFTYDRQAGIIRFDSLMTTTRGPVQNALSTSQPLIVRRQNQPDELLQPDVLSTSWSPLLWFTVMHGVQPTGGAMTTGQSVFVPGSSIIPNLDKLPNLIPAGIIFAWNGVISSSDPFLIDDATRPWVKQLVQLNTSFQANPDLLWPQYRGLRDPEDWFIRIQQTTTPGSKSIYGLSAGEGVLAGFGDGGVFGFSHADFLVADENRLTKFDPNGNPIWSSNVLASAGIDGQENVGNVKPLVRPVRAYAITDNDIVVADPGSNRIARFDLAGREIRSIDRFTLPPAIPDGFKTGDPLTLNGPRDVAVFVTRPTSGTTWIHYLIADTGNRRIVDVVDEYVNNQPTRLGILNWQSPANYSGKNYSYNSISRVFVPGQVLGTGSYYFVAGIGAVQPTGVNTGLDSPAGGTGSIRETASGNGGVVVFDPVTPTNNVVINEVQVPASPANVFYDFTLPGFNSPARGVYTKSMTNLTSVTARVVQIPTLPTTDKTRVAVMFTDSTGVYEVIKQDPSIQASPWIVRWMLPNEAYRAIRRLNNNPPSGQSARDLRAYYARRIDNGDVLVTNGYLGSTLNGAEFNGEVLEINGDVLTETGQGYDPASLNLGFDLKSIVFELPPISGARGLVVPVFADRR